MKRYADRQSLRPPLRGELRACARCGQQVVHSRTTGQPAAAHLSSKACAGAQRPIVLSVTLTRQVREGLRHVAAFARADLEADQDDDVPRFSAEQAAEIRRAVELCEALALGSSKAPSDIA